MSSPETLLQATINRLAARFSQNITKSLAYFSAIARETPEKFQRSWEEFQKEVYEEADRLSNTQPYQESEVDYQNDPSSNSKAQEKIDLIRAKVAELNRTLEDHN